VFDATVNTSSVMLRWSVLLVFNITVNSISLMSWWSKTVKLVFVASPLSTQY
jgi:hypothetical protein